MSSSEQPAATRPRISVRAPVWVAILFSRLLVMATATAGAAFAQIHFDSEHFDPVGFSRHLGSAGNLLAAAADRWDAVHYLAIAHHGYATATSTAFFPMYPLLIHVVGWVTRSYVVAGVLISVVAFTVALELLYRLTREELDGHVAKAAVLLLAFAPLSLFFTAIYTESLFLALSIATFYLARHDRLWLASMTACAASLTHIEGILLIVPLAFCWWERQGSPRDLRVLVRRQAAPVLLPVATLAGLFAYLHALGFDWIAPVSNQAGTWKRQFVGPVIGVFRGFEAGISGLWQTIHGGPTIIRAGTFAFSSSFQGVVYLLVLAMCAAALVQTWERLPKVYAVYSGLYMVVITSSPPQGDPLVSLDRFALVIFPLWIAAAAWLRERSLLRPTIQISTALLIFYSFEFGRWIFVA